jgi:hypothetical protein
MAYSRECPICGANLDPGERCDCRSDVHTKKEHSTECPQTITNYNRNREKNQVVFEVKNMCCEICGHSICVTGCPNAPKPPVIKRCSICSESIYEDEFYMDFDEPICLDCIDNMTVEEAFNHCGYVVRTAEREEW